MADDGSISRDAKWSPPTSPSPEAGTVSIRNPLAYAATAKGNQDRVSNTLGVLHANDAIPDNVKQVIGEAIGRLGSTSNAADADAIVSSTRQAVPDELKDYVARLLSPIAQQIKN